MLILLSLFLIMAETIGKNTTKIQKSHSLQKNKKTVGKSKNLTKKSNSLEKKISILQRRMMKRMYFMASSYIDTSSFFKKFKSYNSANHSMHSLIKRGLIEKTNRGNKIKEISLTEKGDRYVEDIILTNKGTLIIRSLDHLIL